MTGSRLMLVTEAGVDVIAGSIISVALQLVTFPALGLAWAPIHALQAAGLLTLAAFARGTCAWFIRRVRGGRST
ncbi:MAG: hypothetical protein H5U17_17760 [Defluviimonas sp.]|nr:hypothetical protein [Defluviimonas sp.]